ASRPDDAEGWLAAGEACLAAGGPKAGRSAREDFAKAAELLGHDDPRPSLGEGRSHMAFRRHGEALAAFSAAAESPQKTRVLILLVAFAPSFARAGGAKTSPAATAYLDEGITALYSLDYPRSRKAARKLIELEPDNPFGYLFEAGAIWWQSSQEFGLFKDTPTLQGLFEQDIEAGVRKAEAYIDSKDKQTRA